MWCTEPKDVGSYPAGGVSKVLFAGRRFTGMLELCKETGWKGWPLFPVTVAEGT